MIAVRLHTLKHAPWDLADEKLVPRAGPCTSCPKTSCSRPGLFNGFSDTQDLSKALCTDSTCWLAKEGAWLAERVRKAEKDHKGKEVALLHGKQVDGDRFEAAKAARLSLDRTIHHWSWRIKAKSKGGRPGVVISGKRLGAVVYFAEGSSPRPTGEAPRRKTVTEKRTVLKHKRARFVIEDLEATTQDLEWNGFVARLAKKRGVQVHPNQDRLLLDILAAVGTGEVAADLKFPERRPEEQRRLLWTYAREQLVEAIVDLASNASNWKQGAQQLKQLELLAELAGVDVKAKLREAEEELPEPRSWKLQAKAERAEKSTPKAKASRTGTKEVSR